MLLLNRIDLVEKDLERDPRRWSEYQSVKKLMQKCQLDMGL